MTYAGLKSFLYAGVGKDDPRVKAAVDWVRKHYTLEENPGQGDSGLFYYLPRVRQAMAALGEDPFEDAKGKRARMAARIVRHAQRRASRPPTAVGRRRQLSLSHAGVGDSLRVVVIELHDKEIDPHADKRMTSPQRKQGPRLTLACAAGLSCRFALQVRALACACGLVMGLSCRLGFSRQITFSILELCSGSRLPLPLHVAADADSVSPQSRPAGDTHR